ncbi:unnamed protein product [Anisakis simplex]|uniref:Transposase n=1 Tax=Anisakis simplex TaxID=6269 RepID=A0A0M3JRY1_ANISI|nr:unnamed protein product [Anisakis simplex]
MDTDGGEMEVAPVYEDLSQQHVTTDEVCIVEQNEDAEHAWFVAGTAETQPQQSNQHSPDEATSAHNPSWAEWEMVQDDPKTHQDFMDAVTEERYPEYEAPQAFIEPDEHLVADDDNDKYHSNVSVQDEDENSSRSSFELSEMRRKISVKTECDYEKDGNSICPPLPSASTENWIDPPNIAEYFPKTAHYKALAGIRFSIQYLQPSRWEREKENYERKLNYWNEVLNCGKVVDAKDRGRIRHLVRQLKWLWSNSWTGTSDSVIPPEMLWRARKEEMRRFEQFISRKASIVESMTGDDGASINELGASLVESPEAVDNVLSCDGDRHLAVQDESDKQANDIATAFGNKSRMLLLVVMVARQWSEMLPKIIEGPSATKLVDAIEKYCTELNKFCEAQSHPGIPLDCQRCETLFTRGQKLKERILECGLGHLCKHWDLSSHILESHKTLIQSIITCSTPFANFSATDLSNEPMPSSDEDVKPMPASMESAVSSSQGDQFSLEDIIAVESGWLNSYTLLPECKSDRVLPVIDELKQHCKDYRALLKKLLPKAVANAHRSACKTGKIDECVLKLENLFNEMRSEDNDLKRPQTNETVEYGTNQTSSRREKSSHSKSTKSCRTSRSAPPKRSKKSASIIKTEIVSPVKTEHVAMRNERPKRHIQLPARYRLDDELLENEWLARSRKETSHSSQINRSGKSIEIKSEPKSPSPGIQKTPKKDAMEKIILIPDDESSSDKTDEVVRKDNDDDYITLLNNEIKDVKCIRENVYSGKGTTRKVSSYVFQLNDGTQRKVSERAYRRWLASNKKSSPSVVHVTSDTESNLSNAIIVTEKPTKKAKKTSSLIISNAVDSADIRPEESAETSAAQSSSVSLQHKRHSLATKVSQSRSKIRKSQTKAVKEISDEMLSRDKKLEIDKSAVIVEKTGVGLGNSNAERMDIQETRQQISLSTLNTSKQHSAADQLQQSTTLSNCMNVKLKSQNDYLMLMSESGFVESMRHTWMEIPLNGRYNDHVTHIKTLIIALEKCLNDSCATWTDYFDQKQILQSTIDSLLSAFNAEREKAQSNVDAVCDRTAAVSSTPEQPSTTVLSKKDDSPNAAKPHTNDDCLSVDQSHENASENVPTQPVNNDAVSEHGQFLEASQVTSVAKRVVFEEQDSLKRDSISKSVNSFNRWNNGIGECESDQALMRSYSALLLDGMKLLQSKTKNSSSIASRRRSI